MGAYGFGDSRVLEQAREESDVLSNLDSLNPLATGHIRVFHVVQHRWDEARVAHNGRSWVGPIEDMVCEQSLDGSGVVGGDCRARGAVHELGESRVRGSEDSDILSSAQSSGELGKESDKAREIRQVWVARQSCCQVHRLSGDSRSHGCQGEKLELHLERRG